MGFYLGTDLQLSTYYSCVQKSAGGIGVFQLGENRMRRTLGLGLTSLSVAAGMALAIFSGSMARVQAGDAAMAQGTTAAGPQYDASGKLLRPADYREWIYVSSGFGMSYGPGGTDHPQFTNVFVTPASYRYFLQNATWPDKTVFALEEYSSTSHGSINQSGHYQSSQAGLVAEVKDESKGADRWAFYAFGGDTQAASAISRDNCLACHAKNAAVDNTFVQFYPKLLAVAYDKGTVRPDVEIPLSGERMTRQILAKGWAASEASVRVAQKKSPQAEAFEMDSFGEVVGDLASSKRFDDAIGVLNFAKELYPTRTGVEDGLSEIYEAAGKKPESIVAAERVLTLAEKDTTLNAEQRGQLVSQAKQRIERLKK